MLEHDWLLTALIYTLIGCFRSKLSDLTCSITKIWNQAKSDSKAANKNFLSEQIENNPGWDELMQWLLLDMFSLDFDRLFSMVDLKDSLILLLTINW